jgi:hypothetical protein
MPLPFVRGATGPVSVPVGHFQWKTLSSLPLPPSKRPFPRTRPKSFENIFPCVTETTRFVDLYRVEGRVSPAGPPAAGKTGPQKMKNDEKSSKLSGNGLLLSTHTGDGRLLNILNTDY